jgi:hypothetical protein
MTPLLRLKTLLSWKGSKQINQMAKQEKAVLPTNQRKEEKPQIQLP